MNIGFLKTDRNSVKSIIFAVVATVVNVLMSFGVSYMKLPFYFDTIGTIATAAIAGVFPGVMVAVATNILCGLFNSYSIYYTLIGVLVAVTTSRFVRKKMFARKWMIILYILVLAAIGGGIAMAFQWVMQGGPQFSDVADAAAAFTRERSGPAYFAATIVVNIGLNIVDKGLSALVAFLILHFLPAGFKDTISRNKWRQAPLSEDDIRAMNKAQKRAGGASRIALRVRMVVMLTLIALALTLALGFISVTLHFESTREEYKNTARKCAQFAASVVDADRIDEFMDKGFVADGYADTRKVLYSIRDASPGVKYLYVIKIEEDGCYVVFDLDSEDTPSLVNGEKIEFEEAFIPYLPALFAGEEIEPVESDDLSGWVLTAYYPIRNDKGVTTAYACADVSMDYLSDYVKTYFERLLLVFSGFFVLILAYGIWVTDYSLVYPVGKMASSVEGLVKGGGDQKDLDDNVRMIRKLDIRTDDEVERLYDSICKMASDVAEQMRSIRHYADATAQMQNGLILTMADMVESRDSDTGAHVQKTSAYVRIILEGLKEKGYYASKLTPKYMTDVEMSAPLHDVGKINIPDAVLNKPGKLTDEEYEIMKTHTTAGKEILEKAINTVKGGSYLKEARNMAAYHHERWDGKGYPEKLHGEVIPLSARVMSVADVFDALASPRVYKPAFPLEKALSIIEEGAGTQFDPKVVEVFMDHLDDVKEILRKYQE